MEKINYLLCDNLNLLILLHSIITAIDRICKVVGLAASWLTSLLVIIIFSDVIIRYFFNASQAWITEFEWHLFALIFLLGAAFTFQSDDHVRVDLFYTKFNENKKAWINLLGVSIFLIPWCLVVLRSANKYAYNSYQIAEASPDPAGLPARYIIKYAVVVGFFFLLLQALAVWLKSLLVLLGGKIRVFENTKDEL